MFKTATMALAALSMLATPGLARDFTKGLTLPTNKQAPLVIAVPKTAECVEYSAGPAPRSPHRSAMTLRAQLMKMGYTHVYVIQSDMQPRQNTDAVIRLTGC